MNSVPQFPCTKGLVASNQPLAQPKGSVQRASNLVLSSRGALEACDGSQILHSFNGAVQTTRGRFMAAFLYAPVGVPSYYLALGKALTQPLGQPRNLAVTDGGTGGTLAAGTYFYVVTATDGAGGETTKSNEVSITIAANHKPSLTWNTIPNATGYRVYRSTSSGIETLITQTPLTTNSYVDLGAAAIGLIFQVINSVAVTNFLNGVAVGTLYTFFVSNPPLPSIITTFVITAFPASIFDGTYTNIVNIGGNVVSALVMPPGLPTSTTRILTMTVLVSPPATDTTQQTALYQMPIIYGVPAATLPVSYNDSNVVALFPADAQIITGGGGGGGSGGGGGTGGSGNTTNPSTPSGGLPGNVSLLPQFVQFTNRAIIALGNGYPPQIFSDPTGTLVNPALTGAISTVTVDAFGAVTVTTVNPHGILSSQIGGSVVLAGIGNVLYNTNGNGVSAFVITAVPTASTFKIFNPNAIGAGSSSGGTFTVSALPLISTFTPAYPKWAAGQPYGVGDLLVPATQPANAIYLTCIQAGTTGTVEPTWPTGGAASVGTQIIDQGTPNAPGVIWQVAGLLNSTAPPPPGAAHIVVYSGALWVLNTSPTDTANGLDGPTCLRQSSVGNPNSWNPVNQAFLDKDDGSEGMGLAKFTITALGIPPEGSLVAFKNWTPYQIIGVFGASNLTIQAVSSNMGCIAPRTIQFVPGFGIARYTQLGIAIFNGVKDELISEQIRPYLFPQNDRNFQDITVVDSNYIAISWAALTATPPMYVIAAPIGNSLGLLTRLFCYDLVFKAWAVVDLPFPIGTMMQALTLISNPVTVLGGYFDGALQRWQAGDIQWYTGGGSQFQIPVVQGFRTLTLASQDSDQRIYTRRLAITGTNSGAAGTLQAIINQSDVAQFTINLPVAGNGDFDVDIPVGLTGKRFDAALSWSFLGEIDGVTWETEPRPAGVLVGI
jgi:hypothetical protein